ncbi:hypothetical protein A3A39_02675 [Candidatus Kaiserbacteria bacterium RIFCSPLOWO2_01_FULL_54_13]|uniref:Uncharacterized protein n=1 Tax=Candidatus Kaiserbacteria bacterium RIFCSPLOWO2_01_FULL_54_13 TaxID=1798512 RepID=A0A1F6F3K8_9BACT|nr:MAG: hypothetical protein A3A39_02675 [Candidatus Kaiserbacteria bacterium RIFCSPLOWO2_01_FULL_54_13]
MNSDVIRSAIAKDLRGKPSRNPESLIPTLAKELGIQAEAVTNEVHRMTDLKHIVPVGLASIRLSEEGERHYFSTNTEQATHFFQENWPHITSNLIAFFALAIAVFALIK